MAGSGKAKPHQLPPAPTLTLTPTATEMAAPRTVGAQKPKCLPT
nr:MAG TPA: hypothetical protein [Caudoviricetes sp.]